MRKLAALAAVVFVAAGCGTAKSPELVRDGNSDRGARLIERYGCGSCHTIPGIERATGRVGPSLEDFREVRTIAGRLPNNPDNAARWVRGAQKIEPGTIMPDFDMSAQDARDIVAYLYSRT